MKYANSKSGFIIPLTLMILSISIMIVSYIYIRTSVFIPYIDVMAKREQAKMLALGGVNIALEQMLKKDKDGPSINSGRMESKKTDTPDSGRANAENSRSQKPDPAKQLLKNTLPALNRMQTFALKEEVDGLKGEIQIMISCEAGKIPINDVWDFEAQKFIELEDGASGQNVVIQPGGKKLDKKTWKDILQELFKRIETQTGGKKLLEAFEKFLKSRQYKVNDVTELLTIKEFEVFKHSVWYEAPRKIKEKRGEKDHPLYLQDLFTTTSSSKINPWYFSDSILGVLELPRAKLGEIKNREKQMSKWIQNFKPTNTWKTEWEKQLKPVYGVDLQNLPKGIDMIFDSSEVPSYFCVISQGTVDQVTQRLVAIIKTGKLPSIYRMYWL
jgi:hypothetical protein